MNDEITEHKTSRFLFRVKSISLTFTLCIGNGRNLLDSNTQILYMISFVSKAKLRVSLTKDVIQDLIK